MEKYQRLFSKNNKDGVAQFWDFRQDEKRGPEAADPIVFDVTVKCEKKFLYFGCILFPVDVTYLEMHIEWYVPSVVRT